MLALHLSALYYIHWSTFFQYSTVPPLGLANGGTVLTTLVSIDEHPFGDFFREEKNSANGIIFARGFNPNLIFFVRLFHAFHFLHGFHVVIFSSRWQPALLSFSGSRPQASLSERK